MQIRKRFAAATVAAALLAFGAQPHLAYAASGPTDTDITKVAGAARVLGSTCPFIDEVPSVTTDCTNWFVILFKEGIPAKVRTSSWVVYLDVVRFLTYPDGSVEVIHEATGATEDLESVGFDIHHLTSASVRAKIPMSDGTQRRVDLTWDGSHAPLVVAGNYGPDSIDQGIPRHYVDRCVTFNSHSHQTYRADVRITGTIDSVDVASIPYFNNLDPYISRAVFTKVVANHGGVDC